MAIVNAAWEHQEQVRSRPDCSHLVHEIYRLGGFAYPYASSFELYAGIENFARVQAPQPGDLIAWQGHVGIVVDPQQGSFYSSVRSGLRTDFYDAPYWQRHGPARFYRYVLTTRANLTAAARPAERHTASADRVQSRARAASESGGGAADPVSATGRTTFRLPPSILVVTVRGRPTPEEITEAISELSNAAGDILRRDDLGKLPVPVGVFDQVQVERVEMKGERGWAQVRVDTRLTIAGEQIELKRRSEKLRWELRRIEAGWVVFTPPQRAYVPRDVAVRILAAQLARLTQDGAASLGTQALLRQEAKIAHLLNALLSEK